MAEPKRLLLLRHAKSSWDYPELVDRDRPLADRGRRASKTIRAHLRQEQPHISLVLCSSARRARETVKLVRPSGEIAIEPGLYGASAEELLEHVRQVAEEHDVVMLVGHNPALEDLAISLADDASALAGRKFPTAALATLTFTGAWLELAPGRARLESFVTPKELG